ncbi:RES domain-containing protein [Enterocloster clostridioformis]|uniref:RES domain-containing protein n=1 Tax=Enterocloster TaxID=2719313 RepID=UPI001F22C5D4|nr:RES domain-containing protein [Enterocloster clostridioformis]MCF2704086.1 RES domain-containing protein [Enterocloster clostridioformis]
MAQVNLKEAYVKYLSSLNCGCNDEIEKAKYSLLLEANNLLEVIVNYVTLYNFGLKYDFGKSIIPRGTKLYRIRCYDDNTDFSNPNQWKAPPHKPQNRANIKGQEALYLGSSETICLLEAHIKKGSIYALGIYETTANIEVGGYLSYHSNNMLHNLAGVILNAFLIAPSRSSKNEELFSFLDAHYGLLTLDDLADINELNVNGALELPMKFGVLNQLDKYYNLTNQLCNILSEDTPDGIRYSSCYLPMETVGIECSDFNIVLYSEGISKVKLIDHKIKTNINDLDYSDLLKIIINS